MKRKLQILEISLLCILWIGLTLFCWLSPAKDISVSERRPLAQMPQVNSETIYNGSFMTDFESYTLDQFPWRDEFRRIKAFSAFNIFQQKDNNDIYLADGHAVKLEYQLDYASLDNAVTKLNALHDTYLVGTDAKIYFTIVPDKGYYLSDSNGYPSLDNDALVDYFVSRLPFAEYINIYGTLSAEDYYATDSHWKQENLSETANEIAAAMGNSLVAEYDVLTADAPFFGVYYGQAALPMMPDTIHYLSNDILSACSVYNVENGKTTGIYDMEKLNSNDPYEVFLSGAAAILQIDNPNAASGKELIVFRDSFGSSLIPLLVESYEKITLLDTRYVAPEYLPQFVDFQAADDVLMLYSTSILNNSGTLR